MDAATLLDHLTHDLANLPEETKYVLNELKKKDLEINKLTKQIEAADIQLSKYTRQHGINARHPKESLICDEINKNFKEAKKLQNEKILLANTTLLNITKNSAKIDHDIRRLMESGAIEHWDVTDDDIEMIEAPILSTINNNSNINNNINNSNNNNNNNNFKPTTNNSNISSIPDSRSNTNNSAINNNNNIKNEVNDLSKKFNDSTLDNKSQRSFKKSLNRASTPNASSPDSNSTNESKKMTPSRRRDITVPGTIVKGPNRRVISNNANGENTNGDDDELYCFCQQVSYGEMVGCDNENCKYEWFHYGCVGLKEPPVGAWFCPDCAKEMKKFNKKDKKKK